MAESGKNRLIRFPSDANFKIYQDRHDISYIRALGLLLLLADSYSKCIAILGQEVGEVLPWGGIAAQLLPSAGLPQFPQFTQSSKFREAGLVCPGRICILGNIRFLEYQYCLPDLPVSIVTMADIWGFQSSAVQCWMLNVCIFRHSEQLMSKNQYCSSFGILHLYFGHSASAHRDCTDIF